MSKVYILCEGVTEELFVEKVLAPHFAALDIFIVPIPASGTIQKYHVVRKTICSLLRDRSATLVTMMFDYYGLSKNYPGRTNPIGNSPIEKVTFVEQAIQHDINDRRFRAYLSMHEFEALLFSAVGEIASALDVSLRQVERIRQSFPTPEDINDNPNTAPSKRLLGLYSRYVKTIDGIKIGARIGLPSMRAECAHFAEWIDEIESRGRQGNTP